MKPRTMILRTAGTNCDRETAFAFELAGASAESVHINSLLKNPHQLDDYQILAIPGGFSYGDDIAAGRIFASQIRTHLTGMLRRFVDSGKLIIGICNGFQVLVQTELLPGKLSGTSTPGASAGHSDIIVDTDASPEQQTTLAHNDSGRFLAKWVHLSPQTQRCIWTADLPAIFELPIAHGEGRFVVADPQIRRALHGQQRIALSYVNADGTAANGAEPANPNGSTDDIAGICDASGQVFGLMPHPERYVNPQQHPAWSRQQPRPQTGVGLRIFENAVRYAQDGIGAGV